LAGTAIANDWNVEKIEKGKQIAIQKANQYADSVHCWQDNNNPEAFFYFSSSTDLPFFYVPNFVELGCSGGRAYAQTILTQLTVGDYDRLHVDEGDILSEIKFLKENDFIDARFIDKFEVQGNKLIIYSARYNYADQLNPSNEAADADCCASHLYKHIVNLDILKVEDTIFLGKDKQ
jgi:hypothetical protein